MAKLLLYCCKEKNKNDRLVCDEHYGKPFYLYGAITENFESLNGKIVAECDYEVEVYDTAWNCLDFTEKDGLKKSCLTMEQLKEYVKGNNLFYAIHIKNLHIFDKPKELSEYCYKNKEMLDYIDDMWENYGLPDKDDVEETLIKKASQNMMYVYVYENGQWVKYILISIRPQWLVRILNREKTIEVRKVVLKEMLK